MASQDDIQQIRLYLDVRPSAQYSNGYGIFQPSTKTLGLTPETDFYIPVYLEQTSEIYEYVDVQKDESIQVIPRQEINPFILEYAFFDNIARNKINNGQDLSFAQLNFIRSIRFEVSFLNDAELRQWFDNQGKNELPWIDVFGNRTDIYDIEKAQLNIVNIISKADVLKIKVNR